MVYPYELDCDMLEEVIASLGRGGVENKHSTDVESHDRVRAFI